MSSTTTFRSLGVSEATCKALAKQGIEAPFAVQELVIGDALEGRDLLVRSPTGSGKTLAFGAPLIDLVAGGDGAPPKPAALVLAPTRELVGQIVDVLLPLAHHRALAVASVYGGVGFGPQEQRARKAHIIVATPGRLEDLLQRGTFKLDQLEVLVLDEADRMLDMGFKPAVDRIVAQCPEDRQTLLFSATLDERVRKIAAQDLVDPITHEHGDANPDVKDVDMEHRFVKVDHAAKLDRLVRELGDTERALVFVRTKRGADRLVKKLAGRQVEAVAMHGNKTQGQRERALKAFETGQVGTLVATDVAARGIDVPEVSHVINFDAPEDREGYVHRMGRTARAGNTGIGITFVDAEVAKDLGVLARDLGLDREFAASGFSAAAPKPQPRQQGGGGGARRRGGRSRKPASRA
jgi:ATP-dependent RNA helicase RhlE